MAISQPCISISCNSCQYYNTGLQTHCHDLLHTLYMLQAMENDPNANMTKPTGKLFNIDEKGKKDFIKFKPGCFIWEMIAKYLIPALYVLFIIAYFAIYMDF